MVTMVTMVMLSSFKKDITRAVINLLCGGTFAWDQHFLIDDRTLWETWAESDNIGKFGSGHGKYETTSAKWFKCDLFCFTLVTIYGRGSRPRHKASIFSSTREKDIPARLEETLRKFSSMLEDLMRDGIPQTGKSCAFSWVRKEVLLKLQELEMLFRKGNLFVEKKLLPKFSYNFSVNMMYSIRCILKNTFQNFSKNSSQLLLMMNSIGLPMKSSRLPWGWKFAVLNWNWGRSTSPEMLRVSRANCCPPWTNWEPGQEASTWSWLLWSCDYYGEPHHHLWHHQHHDFPPEPEGR